MTVRQAVFAWKARGFDGGGLGTALPTLRWVRRMPSFNHYKPSPTTATNLPLLLYFFPFFRPASGSTGRKAAKRLSKRLGITH